MTYNYKEAIKQLPPKIKSYITKDKDLQNHIKKFQLNREEIILLVEGELGGRGSVKNLDQEKEKLVLAAKNTIKKLQKKKQLTIRLLEGDLVKLKSKAAQEGIPYQTLLGSIIHKALS